MTGFGWNMGYRPSGRKYMSGFLLGASWQKWGDHERNIYIYLGPWLLSIRSKS